MSGERVSMSSQLPGGQMRRRTDGILTTHAGALQRPLALSKAMAEQGEWAPAVLPGLRDQVAAVVRRQLNAGIDIVDDGELGRLSAPRPA
jgi:5-methyltetrahydropteroyltriglutamate--homocysteine methyltransferase